MIAPFPGAWEEIRNRNKVDKILEECWKNPSAGYEIQPTDEWIVNNQQQQQDGDRSDIIEQDEFDAETTIALGKPSTYGEITPLGARQLFGAMGLFDYPRKQQRRPAHFFDLGSGTGKLVGQVVLELPNDTVERATGIELSPSRHESAIRAKEALMRWRRANYQSEFTTLDYDNNDNNNNNNNINFLLSEEKIVHSTNKLELLQDDLFDVDLSTATHIYVASLCFPRNLMLRLEERLRTLLQRQEQRSDDDAMDDDGEKDCLLQWVATLQPFPNNLGGIRPTIRFMEMSWTKPLGCAVYLYRCSSIRNDNR